MAIVENGEFDRGTEEKEGGISGTIATTNFEQRINYKPFSSLRAFSFCMPEGWNDVDLGIFLNSCWHHLQDLANPPNDIYSTWIDIAKYGAEKSLNPTLFNVNNCIELADALRNYIHYNEKTMSDNETFVKFHQDIKSLLKYFVPPPPEANQGGDLLESTLSQLIYQNLALIHEGNPHVWSLLSKAINEKIAFSTNVQLFLELTKRKIILLVEKEKDPLRKKEIFSQKTKKFMLEVFDYIAPTSVKKSDFLTNEPPVKDNETKLRNENPLNKEEVLKKEGSGFDNASSKKRKASNINENEPGVKCLKIGEMDPFRESSCEKEIKGVITEVADPKKRKLSPHNEEGRGSEAVVDQSSLKEINKRGRSESVETDSFVLQKRIHSMDMVGSNNGEIKFRELGKTLGNINTKLNEQSEKGLKETEIQCFQKDHTNKTKSSASDEKDRKTAEFQDCKTAISMKEKTGSYISESGVREKEYRGNTIPNEDLQKNSKNDSKAKEIDTIEEIEFHSKANGNVVENPKSLNTRSSEIYKYSKGIEADETEGSHRTSKNTRSTERSKDARRIKVNMTENPHPKAKNTRSSEIIKEIKRTEANAIGNSHPTSKKTRSSERCKEVNEIEVNAIENSHPNPKNSGSTERCKDLKEIEAGAAENPHPMAKDTRNSGRHKEIKGIEINVTVKPDPKSETTRSSESCSEVKEIEVDVTENSHPKPRNTRSSERCKEIKGTEANVTGNPHPAAKKTRSSERCKEFNEIEVNAMENCHPNPKNSGSTERCNDLKEIEAVATENPHPTTKDTRNSGRYKEVKGIEVNVTAKPDSKIENTRSSERCSEVKEVEVDITENSHPKTRNTRSSERSKEKKGTEANVTGNPHPAAKKTRSSERCKEVKEIEVEVNANNSGSTDRCKDVKEIKAEATENPNPMAKDTRNSGRYKEVKGIEADGTENPSTTKKTKGCEISKDVRVIEVDVMENSHTNPKISRSCEKFNEIKGVELDVTKISLSKTKITRSSERCKEVKTIEVDLMRNTCPTERKPRSSESCKEGKEREVDMMVNPHPMVKNTRSNDSWKIKEIKVNVTAQPEPKTENAKCKDVKGIEVEAIESHHPKTKNSRSTDRCNEVQGIKVDMSENPHPKAANSEKHKKVEDIEIDVPENPHPKPRNTRRSEKHKEVKGIKVDVSENPHPKATNSEKHKEVKEIEVDVMENPHPKTRNTRSREKYKEIKKIEVDVLENPYPKATYTRNSEKHKDVMEIIEVSENTHPMARNSEKHKEVKEIEVDVLENPHPKARNTRSSERYKEVKKVEVDLPENSHPKVSNTRNNEKHKEVKEIDEDLIENSPAMAINTRSREREYIEKGIRIPVKAPQNKILRDTKVVKDAREIKIDLVHNPITKEGCEPKCSENEQERNEPDLVAVDSLLKVSDLERSSLRDKFICKIDACVMNNDQSDEVPSCYGRPADGIAHNLSTTELTVNTECGIGDDMDIKQSENKIKTLKSHRKGRKTVRAEVNKCNFIKMDESGIEISGLGNDLQESFIKRGSLRSSERNRVEGKLPKKETLTRNESIGHIGEMKAEGDPKSPLKGRDGLRRKQSTPEIGGVQVKGLQIPSFKRRVLEILRGPLSMKRDVLRSSRKLGEVRETEVHESEIINLKEREKCKEIDSVQDVEVTNGERVEDTPQNNLDMARNNNKRENGGIGVDMLVKSNQDIPDMSRSYDKERDIEIEVDTSEISLQNRLEVSGNVNEFKKICLKRESLPRRNGLRRKSKDVESDHISQFDASRVKYDGIEVRTSLEISNVKRESEKCSAKNGEGEKKNGKRTDVNSKVAIESLYCKEDEENESGRKTYVRPKVAQENLHPKEGDGDKESGRKTDVEKVVLENIHPMEGEGEKKNGTKADVGKVVLENLHPKEGKGKKESGRNTDVEKVVLENIHPMEGEGKKENGKKTDVGKVVLENLHPKEEKGKKESGRNTDVEKVVLENLLPQEGDRDKESGRKTDVEKVVLENIHPMEGEGKKENGRKTDVEKVALENIHPMEGEGKENGRKTDVEKVALENIHPMEGEGKENGRKTDVEKVGLENFHPKKGEGEKEIKRKTDDQKVVALENLRLKVGDGEKESGRETDVQKVVQENLHPNEGEGKKENGRKTDAEKDILENLHPKKGEGEKESGKKTDVEKVVLENLHSKEGVGEKENGRTINVKKVVLENFQPKDRMGEKESGRNTDIEPKVVVESLHSREDEMSSAQSVKLPKLQKFDSGNKTDSLIQQDSICKNNQHSKMSNVTCESSNLIEKVSSSNISSNPNEVVIQNESLKNSLNIDESQINSVEKCLKKRRGRKRKNVSPGDGVLPKNVADLQPPNKSKRDDVLKHRLRPRATLQADTHNKSNFVNERVMTVKKVTTVFEESTICKKKPYVKLIDICKDSGFVWPISSSVSTVATSSYTHNSDQLTLTNVKERISFTSLPVRKRGKSSSTSSSKSKVNSVPCSSKKKQEKMSASLDKKEPLKVIKTVVKPFNYDSSKEEGRNEIFHDQTPHDRLSLAPNPHTQRTNINSLPVGNTMQLTQETASIECAVKNVLTHWDKLVRENNRDMDSLSFQDLYLTGIDRSKDNWFEEYFKCSQKLTTWKFQQKRISHEIHLNKEREKIEDLRKTAETLMQM